MFAISRFGRGGAAIDRNLPEAFQELNMLKTQLLHPDILSIIARAGHHGKILIADGNYPASSTLGPNAKLVSLQLMPGVPTVTQVLQAILPPVPLDRATTMDYERTGPYALHEDHPVGP